MNKRLLSALALALVLLVTFSAVAQTTFLVPKNSATGKLLDGIDNADTSLTLESGDGANFPSTFPYHVVLGTSEIVRVTARAGDVLTVTRAQEGTTAIAHPAGQPVSLNVTAEYISEIQTAVNTAETDIDTIESDAAFLDQAETIAADWDNTAFPWDDDEVSNTLTLGAASTVDDGALSANVGLLDGNLTLTGDWDNSANPWTDAEVDDDLTVNSTKDMSTTGTFLSEGNATIGAGQVDVDHTLTFNGETNDNVITALEDEHRLSLSGGLALALPLLQNVGTTFTGGDATPSVASGNIFFLSGTPTTITGLDDGVQGQVVMLVATDNDTDITDGANLALQGNFTGAADDAIILVNVDGTLWKELGRNDSTPLSDARISNTLTLDATSVVDADAIQGLGSITIDGDTSQVFVITDEDPTPSATDRSVFNYQADAPTTITKFDDLAEGQYLEIHTHGSTSNVTLQDGDGLTAGLFELPNDNDIVLTPGESIALRSVTIGGQILVVVDQHYEIDLEEDEIVLGDWNFSASPHLDAEVSDTLTIGASSTVADGALSANVPLLDAATNAFTGDLDVQGGDITNTTGNLALNPNAGVGTISLSATTNTLTRNYNGVTTSKIVNTDAGAGAYASLEFQNDLSNGLLVLHGSGRTTTSRLGTAVAGFLELRINAAQNGIMFSTDGPDPILFGTNDLLDMTIETDGDVKTERATIYPNYELTDADTTPDVSSGKYFWVDAASPYSITEFDGTEDGQEFVFGTTAVSSTVTIKHNDAGATVKIITSTAADIALPAGRSIVFHRRGSNVFMISGYDG